MMIERIRPWVQGKKVLILGFGREGKSTWNVLKKLDCCSFVDVADMAEPKEKPEGIRNWIAGPDYQKCLNEYDVVFKSPGVVLEKPVQSYSSQILSQTELFSSVSGIRSSELQAQREKYDHNPDLSSVKGSWDGYDPGRKHRYSCV